MRTIMRWSPHGSIERILRAGAGVAATTSLSSSTCLGDICIPASEIAAATCAVVIALCPVAARAGITAEAASVRAEMNVSLLMAVLPRVSLLLSQLVQLLKHFVRGLHYARVGLVRALRQNHVHEFVDNIDVRLLQHPLLDGAETIGAAR